MDDISLDTNQDSNRSESGDLEIQIEDPKSIESISSPVLVQESTLNSHISESLRGKEIKMDDLSYQSPNIDERSEKSQSKDTEMEIEEQKALTFDKKTINTLFSSTLLCKLTQQTSATESSSELTENSSRKRLQNIEEEAISLWRQCHLEKGTKKKWYSYCQSHQTNYLYGKCNVSVCLIPCYDLHRIHRQ